MSQAKRVVSLIGMPGGGKSSVGRLLAKRLGVPFLDADEAIVRQAGCSIEHLFEFEGESGFRARESEVLKALLHSDAAVVATGGGAVLSEDNRQLLRTATLPVYLYASPAELWRRVRGNTRRPLLRVADPRARLDQMFAERHPLYCDVAAITIETGRGPIGSLVTELVARLGDEGIELPGAPQPRQP